MLRHWKNTHGWIVKASTCKSWPTLVNFWLLINHAVSFHTHTRPEPWTPPPRLRPGWTPTFPLSASHGATLFRCSSPCVVDCMSLPCDCKHNTVVLLHSTNSYISVLKFFFLSFNLDFPLGSSALLMICPSAVIAATDSGFTTNG